MSHRDYVIPSVEETEEERMEREWQEVVEEKTPVKTYEEKLKVLSSPHIIRVMEDDNALEERDDFDRAVNAHESRFMDEFSGGPVA